MPIQEITPNSNPDQVDGVQGLQQALLRLTSSRFEEQQEEVQQLGDSLKNLQKSVQDLEGSLNQHLGERGLRKEDLDALIQQIDAKLNQFDKDLESLASILEQDREQHSQKLQREVEQLQRVLGDSQEVVQRVNPVLVSMIHDAVRQEEDEFAQAIAPVIGPAIRHQIRQAKDDIIDALYPLIGQIIGKAISEALRELTRNIDERFRQRFDLRSVFRRIGYRIRGISEAEMLLRESLPFSVEHVFLIHYETGLLLKHVSKEGEEDADLDTIGAMLTAIRDFVRDSFNRPDSDLEEITHGDQRILLEGGRYTYLAVIIEGIEPAGYSNLMHTVISDINLQHESQLRDFDGDMDRIPDLGDELEPLYAQTSLEAEPEQAPLSRKQRWALVLGMLGVVILVALVIFGCVFTMRLWPIAFPGSLSAVTPSVLIPVATTMQYPPYLLRC